MDKVTREIKTATHVIFDEAHLTSTKSKAPPAAAILQHLGLNNADQSGDNVQVEVPPCNVLATPPPTEPNIAQIVLLTPHATMPTRGTSQSVCYDLYSAKDTAIEPMSRTN